MLSNAPRIEHDRVARRVRTTDDTRAAAAWHHGDVMRPEHAHRRRDLVRAGGPHDRERPIRRTPEHGLNQAQRPRVAAHLREPVCIGRDPPLTEPRFQVGQQVGQQGVARVGHHSPPPAAAARARTTSSRTPGARG